MSELDTILSRLRHEGSKDAEAGLYRPQAAAIFCPDAALLRRERIALHNAYNQGYGYHVECPEGCGVPWRECPWCRATGVPHAVMRECKYWLKADNEYGCARCGCDHKDKPEPHYYDTFMHHELCKSGCTEWVRPLSPCDKWLKERAA